MQKSKPKNKSLNKKVYLDYGASTPIDLFVLNKMNKAFRLNFANPMSIHEEALFVASLVEKERHFIANILKCRTNEVIFTSGSTESNNIALLGLLPSFKGKGVPHVIISNIEHSSLHELCIFLKNQKRIELDYLKVDKNGFVSPKDLRNLLKKNTILVSVIYANNEIGTIQSIKEISKEIRFWNKNNLKNKVFFHTDATQAVNYLSIDTEKLGVDMMSFNAHKIYGPKGVGVLFKKDSVPLLSIFHGGPQEFGLRAGTTNYPLILGLSEALKIIEKTKEIESKRLSFLRDYFFKKIKQKIPEIILNGSLENRLPNNINVTIPKIPSDLLVVELSNLGIFASEKSACKSKEKNGSYVISALHQKDNADIPSLRFSLGRYTKKEDIDYTVASLSRVFKKLSLWYK